jgi:hypothetical protein
VAEEMRGCCVPSEVDVFDQKVRCDDGILAASSSDHGGIVSHSDSN